MSPDDKPGDPEALLRTPRGDVLFVQVPDAKTVKNRTHLDLEPSDRSRDDEVARLVTLGASRVDDQRRPDGTGWVVLADPEGNELCVLRSEAERAATKPTGSQLERGVVSERSISTNGAAVPTGRRTSCAGHRRRREPILQPCRCLSRTCPSCPTASCASDRSPRPMPRRLWRSGPTRRSARATRFPSPPVKPPRTGSRATPRPWPQAARGSGRWSMPERTPLPVAAHSRASTGDRGAPVPRAGSHPDSAVASLLPARAAGRSTCLRFRSGPHPSRMRGRQRGVRAQRPVGRDAARRHAPLVLRVERRRARGRGDVLAARRGSGERALLPLALDARRTGTYDGQVSPSRSPSALPRRGPRAGRPGRVRA